MMFQDSPHNGAMALVIGALTASIVTVPAHGAVKYDIAAATDITIASNPLLVAGPDTAALAAEFSIEPGVRWTNDTGSFLAVDGVLTGRTYSRRYGSFLLGRARAEAVLRRNEHLSLRASANFNRDLAADILTEAVDAGTDPRSTRNTLLGLVSLDWRPDALTTISPLIRFESTQFTDSVTLDDSNLQGAELRIQRRMSARTRIGVAVLGNISEIGDTGRFATVTLLGTVEQQFGPFFQATAELGIERNRDRVSGTTATRFSGNIRLCANNTRTSGCFTAAVASDASSVGTLQRRYTVGASARHAIGPQLDMVAAADYQRAASAGTGQTPTFAATTIRIGLDWRIRRNVTLGSQVEYRQRDQRGSSAIDSAYAGINLRWQR